MPLYVSAVIPSYNGAQLLKKNLPAVLACLRAGDEIVIIDDASDKSKSGLDWLNNNFKKLINKKNIKLKIIKNSKNLRFAQSCNKAVKVASHNLIFLLNNDVSPHKDCLKYLLPYFADQQVFVVACLELENKNNKKIKHGKNRLWFEKGLFMHGKASNFKAGETAWATGGSSIFDKQKFLELNGFDKKFYPAYWEDIDLSFRARKKGWRVLFEPQAIVDHNHESTHSVVFGDKKINKMSWRNAQKFTLKHANLLQKLLYWIYQPYWCYKKSF